MVAVLAASLASRSAPGTYLGGFGHCHSNFPPGDHFWAVLGILDADCEVALAVALATESAAANEVTSYDVDVEEALVGVVTAPFVVAMVQAGAGALWAAVGLAVEVAAPYSVVVAVVAVLAAQTLPPPVVAKVNSPLQRLPPPVGGPAVQEVDPRAPNRWSPSWTYPLK